MNCTVKINEKSAHIEYQHNVFPNHFDSRMIEFMDEECLDVECQLYSALFDKVTI